VAAKVPLAEFRVADANAAYRGVAPATLMENAGRAVARQVERRVKGAHPSLIVFCGKGNNGGDGLAAARELSLHFRVTVIFAEGRGAVDPLGPSAGPLHDVLGDISIAKVDWARARRGEVAYACRRADALLDCLLGSGISGPARPPYGELISLINRAPCPRISVDVPSGFPFTPCVRPGVTLTIEAPKVGMTRANSGEVVSLAIGFPRKAWTHTGPGELLLVPQVDDFADKRERGVLALVAGGPYTGAPALAALAAHAAGVGLVHIFAPASAAEVVRRFDPTLVVHPLEGDVLAPEHAKPILHEIRSRRCGALAIGPGLGRAPRTADAVREIIALGPAPSVVDADAVAPCASLGKGALSRAVLTPHAGEFKALWGRRAPDARDTSGRMRAASAAARARRTTILLKGHITVISDGRRTKLNDAGVSAQAVGGAGDVLTGIVGALLSKGMSPFDAGRAGAFVAGKAGELAFGDLGHSLKPTDLIAAVPRVFARYLPWWGGKP
jgi:ADP-dependent NAD(P)H-hydrate dehydratase / NAD(P)H-hydrate epimerase